LYCDIIHSLPVHKLQNPSFGVQRLLILHNYQYRYNRSTYACAMWRLKMGITPLSSRQAVLIYIT
jgi:hypothetical protein